MGVSRRGAPAAIVSKDKRGLGERSTKESPPSCTSGLIAAAPRSGGLTGSGRLLVEGSTGSGPGVGPWAAQRTQAAATRTLARRRASRSRFTRLCLYEVELSLRPSLYPRGVDS
eukprot:scaffold14824_cov68-Phaeocystis_antarctica.AAC.3